MKISDMIVVEEKGRGPYERLLVARLEYFRSVRLDLDVDEVEAEYRRKKLKKEYLIELKRAFEEEINK